LGVEIGVTGNGKEGSTMKARWMITTAAIAMFAAAGAFAAPAQTPTGLDPLGQLPRRLSTWRGCATACSSS
jgi:hypothetical protein